MGCAGSKSTATSTSSPIVVKNPPSTPVETINVTRKHHMKDFDKKLLEKDRLNHGLNQTVLPAIGQKRDAWEENPKPNINVLLQDAQDLLGSEKVKSSKSGLALEFNFDNEQPKKLGRLPPILRRSNTMVRKSSEEARNDLEIKQSRAEQNRLEQNLKKAKHQKNEEKRNKVKRKKAEDEEQFKQKAHKDNEEKQKAADEKRKTELSEIKRKLRMDIERTEGLLRKKRIITQDDVHSEIEAPEMDDDSDWETVKPKKIDDSSRDNSANTRHDSTYGSDEGEDGKPYQPIQSLPPIRGIRNVQPYNTTSPRNLDFFE